MLVGVDFDNTIVSYDALFWNVALEKKLIPESVPPVKNAVRDHLRAAGQEQTWIELQGYIYGKRMNEAVPYKGVIEFFRQCRNRSVPVCIISHKTERPYAGPEYDLHKAARGWLCQYGFHDLDGIGLAEDRVFFHPTKRDKVARVFQQRCTVFIDDLPEIFEEPEFPQGVEKILFSSIPSIGATMGTEDARFASWKEISRYIFQANASQRPKQPRPTA